MELPEADRALAIAYVTGDLTEEERIELELRMASEPDLATTVRELLDTDEVVWRGRGRTRARDARRPNLWTPVAWLAAAAAMLLLLRPVLWPTAPRIQVAVLPTGATLRTNNELLGLDGLPAGHRLRGEDVLEVAADEYVRRAGERTAERASAALAGTEDAFTGTFVIAASLPGERSVVVYLLDSNGVLLSGPRIEAGVAYPPPPWDESSGRQGAGLQVLPPQFELERVGGTTLVEYQSGFVIPRELERVQVLLASRKDPLDEGLRSVLLPPEALGEPSRPILGDLVRRLEANGFEVQRLEARER